MESGHAPRALRAAQLVPGAVQGLRLLNGYPDVPMLVVELDDLTDAEAALRPALPPGVITVGISRTPLPPQAAALCSELTLTLVDEQHESASDRWQVGVPDVDAALTTVTEARNRHPTAAHTLAGLLRITAATEVRDALVSESLAYSMLMAGREHAVWLAGRDRRPVPDAAEPVRIQRQGDLLTISLNRPERHNAFGRAVRDGLVGALELVLLDDSIERVRMTGTGASFCSGGDLDEFGLTQDVTIAHLIRVDRTVAARLEAVRDRVEVELHGACIGAGIEIASFAHRVVARRGARIQLPEISMGLVPGAGGTVGITRRIGRWRTAWVALSGQPVTLPTALRWGLIDDVVP